MFKNYFAVRKLVACALAYTALFFSPIAVFSQTPVLQFNLVTSGLSSPVDIVQSGDASNRLFVVEKSGKIRIISNGVLLTDPFLDVGALLPANNNATEQGLLSLAFHPQYATNKYFFIYYNNSAGNIEIARYQTSADPLVALSNSGQVLLTIPHPDQSNHNGGKLNFGADGNLYFATGDGGGGGDLPNNSQNGNSLLGKMLRINVDNFASSSPFYTIPTDNPYIADPAVLDEIWALGLRNPFRWSFDRLTHDMWIADVGQNNWEEVNFRPVGNTGGINYGWRCYEGMHAYNTAGCAGATNYVFPIFEYGHDNTTGGSSITGGYVYRGTRYPTLYGYYIVADYMSANVWLIKPDGSGGWTASMQAGLAGAIVGFGEDANGELYAVSINTGSVYQVDVLNSLPLKLVSFNGASESGGHLLRWQTSSEQDVKQFEIEYSANGTNFQTIGIVRATNSTLGQSYEYKDRIHIDDRSYYRLKIVDNSGQVEYSNIIHLIEGDEGTVFVTPTLVHNKRVNVRFNKPFNSIQLIDMNGHVVKTIKPGQAAGFVDLDVSGLPGGMYTIRLLGNNSSVYRKIMIQ